MHTAHTSGEPGGRRAAAMRHDSRGRAVLTPVPRKMKSSTAGGGGGGGYAFLAAAGSRAAAAVAVVAVAAGEAPAAAAGEAADAVDATVNTAVADATVAAAAGGGDDVTQGAVRAEDKGEGGVLLSTMNPSMMSSRRGLVHYQQKEVDGGWGGGQCRPLGRRGVVGLWQEGIKGQQCDSHRVG